MTDYCWRRGVIYIILTPQRKCVVYLTVTKILLLHMKKEWLFFCDVLAASIFFVLPVLPGRCSALYKIASRSIRPLLIYFPVKTVAYTGNPYTSHDHLVNYVIIHQSFQTASLHKAAQQ